MAAYYSIRDLEELSGVKAHTIRMWEKRYGVIHPGRTDTNIRFYGNDELRKLLNVSLLVRNGYRISVVSTMSEKELTGAVAGLAPTGDEAWENLLLSLIELDESRFRRTFTGLTQELGFEQAVFQVIFPFFDRVG
ncbi:MAG: MerR family transcriptional regulator, partial [Siphonobacter aquaeclarae]|nr:MerR family transcriptional regulator [Siphonobacter aquaeclarae]